MRMNYCAMYVLFALKCAINLVNTQVLAEDGSGEVYSYSTIGGLIVGDDGSGEIHTSTIDINIGDDGGGGEVRSSTVATIIGDDGSGEVGQEVVQVNVDLTPNEVFRDLICFDCTGSSCPTLHYQEPIRDMIVSCQACYKEWNPASQESTRKCFFPSDLTEHVHVNNSVVSSHCGVIERSSRLSYYCFCYEDYCNSAPRSRALSALLLLVPPLLVAGKRINAL